MLVSSATYGRWAVSTPKRSVTIDLQFLFDTRQLNPFRNRRVERAIARAASKAGGDGIRSMRTDATRKVRERKRMKAGKVRAALPLVFPGRKELASLIWRMKVSGRVVPVSEYPGVRQVKAGVSVQINRQGARKVIPSAFVAVLKSGHKGVFRRKSKARLPIEELFSTKVSDVFGDADLIPALHEAAQKMFSSTFVRVLPLELDKARAHAG